MELGFKIYFLITGITLLMLAIILSYRRLIARMKGVTVTGRVVDHAVRTIDDSTSYLPIVEFVDRQGKQNCFTSVSGGSDRFPEVGAEVRVCYFPSNPDIAYIQSFLHMWAAPAACAIIGLAAIIAVWV